MIDFCIPYVPQAHHHLVSLIENLIVTTSNFNRLRFFVSCHSDEAVWRIKSDKFLKSNSVINVIAVPPVGDSLVGAGSANHTRALNALKCVASSDIVIFSDSDIRFLVKDWDIQIVEIFADVQVFGTPYSNILWPGSATPHCRHIHWLNAVSLAKYQGIPNATFIAFKNSILKNYFPKKLSEFDAFLLSDSLPYRVINSTELSWETNLPLGTIQWLDTGWEFPHIFSKNDIKFKSLDYVAFEHQTLIPLVSELRTISPQHRPEVFNLNGTPFLAHYKKGSGKALQSGFDNLLSVFECSVKQSLV